MEGEMIPEVVLSSGWKMPVIGMGTVASPLPAPEILKSTLVEAIKAGYRHFDTASLYGSEEPLGQAVAEALKQGLIDKRDDIFITSKLWVTDAHPDLVLSAIKTTLQKLDLEYVDLYLIHWPIRSKKEAGLLPSRENLLPLDMKGTWEAMEECCKLGLVKSIGVSNFSCKKLSQLLEHATIPPAVDQVELNPGWQQKKLIEFCKEKGIHVTAFSPLGANGAPWGSFAVMDSPVLKDIATNKGRSIAQISLRWIYEQGASLIVKSFDKERMKENLHILDWKLSDEDLAKIKQIPQCRGSSGEMFVSPHGPYKSLEELWDGEF